MASSRQPSTFGRKLRTIEERDTSPWYWGYLFQGTAILGVLPILIPIVVAQTQGASAVGMVVAAFYLGQVLSPVLGQIADRTGKHSFFYLAGYVLVGCGAFGFALVDNLPLWLCFACIQGIGAGSSNTTSYSFIVEFTPRKEWDGRLGWLQTFYGAGQAIGLVLAAVLQADARLGMMIAAGLMIPGVILGSLKLPRQKRTRADQERPPTAHRVPAHGPARSPTSILRHYEHLGLGGLKSFAKIWCSRLGLYLLSWFFLMVGTWIIYNFFPLLMQQSYGISPGLSSLYYGIAATIGVFFYAPSGTWAEQFGSARLVMIGALATLVTTVALVLLVPLPAAMQQVLVPIFFILMPVAWSPLIVAGTALAGELTTIAEGTTMGLYNACTAVASVTAAVVGGWIASVWNYAAASGVAAAMTLLAILLLLPFLKRSRA